MENDWFCLHSIFRVYSPKFLRFFPAFKNCGFFATLPGDIQDKGSILTQLYLTTQSDNRELCLGVLFRMVAVPFCLPTVLFLQHSGMQILYLQCCAPFHEVLVLHSNRIMDSHVRNIFLHIFLIFFLYFLDQKNCLISF